MRIRIVNTIGVVLGCDHRQLFAVVTMTPEILCGDLAEDPGKALFVLFFLS